MRRVALIGPGAVGGTVAAWLGQVADIDLTLCVRTPFEQLRVETPDGRRLESSPRILADPSAAGVAAGPMDWVIAITKTYDTEGAARWLPGLVGPETRLAVIQNGVEQRERFREVFPVERTLPSIIDLPAERTGPGRIRQRAHGTIAVPAGVLGDDFVALFDGTPLAARTTDDFVTAAWRKLAVNSAGVVNALTSKPNRIAHDERIAAVVKGIAAETVAVGRAEGARLDDSVPEWVVARFRASAPDSVNSLLADRLAGRPMEVDARNGVVVRRGARHGIPTPLNAMAVAILTCAAAD